MERRLSQHARMLRLMRRAPKNGVPNYKFSNHGILCYSKRISELRNEGWNIQGIRVFDKDGKATGVWRYKLIEE